MEQTFQELLNKKDKTYPEEMLCQFVLMYITEQDKEKTYNKILKRVEFIKKMKAKKR